ncbi:Mpo1-like protein [Gammaproteobacteria bacterium AB-CW1]|uniref:Mpo1-like protein n=1 Tax=Natronospira elongata TaxID=3110268 RepID=A0AAP6JDS2_9GAMM|nr:Mpo1-like protein [Gammaproteobacteria bacterium AB-CW1]
MLRGGQAWIRHYGDSRQHPVNRRMHLLGLPLTAFGLLTLLWALNIPVDTGTVPLHLNAGLMVVMAAVVYAFLLSPFLAIPFSLGALLAILAVDWLANQGLALAPSGAALMLAGWLLLARGHRAEGNRPDWSGWIQHLPVGLVWLLARGFDRWRLPW